MISTPNLSSLHAIFFLLLGWQPLTAKVSDQVRVGNPVPGIAAQPGPSDEYPGHAHLRIFTMKALKELFRYHGFKVEQAEGYGYYPFAGKMAKFMSRMDARHSVFLAIKVRKFR